MQCGEPRGIIAGRAGARRAMGEPPIVLGAFKDSGALPPSLLPSYSTRVPFLTAVFEDCSRLLPHTGT